MYYKKRVTDSLIDLEFVEERVVNGEYEYIKLSEVVSIPNGWTAITKAEFDAVKPPEPATQPSELDIISAQLVEKDLQILALQEENRTLGQMIVDLDLRLLQGGL